MSGWLLPKGDINAYSSIQNFYRRHIVNTGFCEKLIKSQSFNYWLSHDKLRNRLFLSLGNFRKISVSIKSWVYPNKMRRY